MTDKIVFSETQKFKQWWLWLILIGLNGLLIFGVSKQVIGGEKFGDQPATDTTLLFITGFVFLLSILFFNFRLETRVQTDGVYVRFFPFHRSFKYYSWEVIDRCYLRSYRPIGEYGGWGIRTGNKGNALNISGNQGLQLEFNNHDRLLIGTNKAKELAAVLDEIRGK
ncbi:DUF6141 family protein [Pedobacter caeni]|uniref:Uncharacterized protein n=1 Tax=Pedobacter caeni TaxID=288992 RepID=A0A1M5HRR8_9SPHI|nr:DUF6141 family protein [Pedobacter caeni]SHG18623.1 hypothetical protein SAMN04488522_104782 [Pedobacter caeni]